MLICGIDEAGKGPLFGDLVVGGCLIDKDNLDKLDNLGADSKSLTAKKREHLFPLIKNVVKDYKLENITAYEIDSKNKMGINLNLVELFRIAKIINELNPDLVIIDCPHPSPEKFEKELRQYLDNQKITIVAEHKADLNYPIVGAASILAKVTRDAHIHELSEKIGIDLGSGYPADPKTKKALELFFEKNIKELDTYIRHTWSTYERKKKELSQKKLF